MHKDVTSVDKRIAFPKTKKMGFRKSQKETQKTIKMEQSIISSRKCESVGPEVNRHKFQLFPNQTSPSERIPFHFHYRTLFSFVLIKTFITFYGFCFNPWRAQHTQSFEWCFATVTGALKVNEICVCDDFYLMKVNRNLWRRTKSFDGRGEKVELNFH